MNDLEFLDTCGLPRFEGLLKGARRLAELGHHPKIGILPFRAYEDTLWEVKGNVGGIASSFPAPGFFLNAPDGYIYVTADSRLIEDVAYVVDPCSCARVRLRIT